MKIVNIISIVAACSLIMLFVFCFSAKNNLEMDYEQTLHSIMQTEGFQTEKEVFNAYPVLLITKSQLAKVKQYHYEISEYQRGFQGPQDRQMSQGLFQKIEAKKELEARVKESLSLLKKGV